MKAFVKLRPIDGAVELRDMPQPVRRAGWAIVKVTGAGICGTDVAIWKWREAVVGQYAPDFPLVIGHEFGGTVVESERFPAGTLVAVNPQIACGRCAYCHRGRPTLCIDRKLMGGRINGGWTEYVAVPEQNLYALPAGTRPVIAALAEPLSVAVHAVVERVAPRQGDVVAVIGAGPIGLLCLILARQAGASKVLVSGIEADAERLKLVEALGGVPVNVARENLDDRLRSFQSDGADVVYETSGSHVVAEQAIGIARRGGRIGLIGLCHAPSTFVSTPIVLKELELIGSRGYNDTTWEEMTRILPAVQDDVVKLVSHELPLARAEDALRLVEARQANKIILLPDAA